MDYQSYEDYMRQVLGYSSYNPNIYETYDYRMNIPYADTYYRNDSTFNLLNEDEISELYPKIYHILNPMICKICDANNQPITKELIEKMTDEVYNALEVNNDTIVNVRVETKKDDNTREIRNSFTEKDRRMVNSKLEPYKETRQLSEPKRTNQTLKDLIKILILKQLLGENRPDPRPPRPKYP